MAHDQGLFSHYRSTFVWEHPEWWVALVSLACWWLMLSSHHHLDPVSGWWLMVGAMMLPMQISQIRFIAFKSPPRTRQVSVLLFIAGHLLVWGSVSLVFVFDHRLAHPDPYAPALGFLAAALWAHTPYFRSALIRSHATGVVYTQGWARLSTTFGHGVRVGLACFVTCVPAMLACAWSHHYSPVMILGFLAAYCLKASHRARTSVITCLYLVCALITFP